MNWFQCEGNYDGSDWFGACCGKQFIYGVVDGFLFGMQLTDDPTSVVWVSAVPPQGLVLNYLDYMKFGTAIFNGNFNPDQYARAATAQERIDCLMNLIQKDNDLFVFALTDPRIKKPVKKIVEPINPYPNRKFAVRNDLLTLTSDMKGLNALFLDFSELPIWGVDAKKKKIDGKEWKNIINLVWSTWDHAQAMAFIRIPETQQHKKNSDKTDCAKRLCRLANAASIRSEGVWTCGTPASKADKEWAAGIWPFPVDRPLQGAKGMLAICDGALA